MTYEKWSISASRWLSGETVRSFSSSAENFPSPVPERSCCYSANNARRDERKRVICEMHACLSFNWSHAYSAWLSCKEGKIFLGIDLVTIIIVEVALQQWSSRRLFQCDEVSSPLRARLLQRKTSIENEEEEEETTRLLSFRDDWWGNPISCSQFICLAGFPCSVSI